MTSKAIRWPSSTEGEHVGAGHRRSPNRVMLASSALVCGALLLAVHGLIHVIGFATTWGVSRLGAMPQGYTLVGGLNAYELKALGLLWLVALVLFVAAAAGLVLRRAWWRTTAFVGVLLSLVLCLLWLGPAKWGADIDVVLFIGLLISSPAPKLNARETVR